MNIQVNDNQLFGQIFKKLNSKQQEAVSHIDGPVLVIAGPGTGKTQILAARTACILSATDTQPEQILCLTYTDAGTVAMRKRLLEMIGTDAYRMPIHTFHSFCNLVISENSDYFGLAGLDPVSELEQVQVVHSIIDELEQGNVLKRYTGDVYFDTRNLLSLYSTMKKEGWSSSHIIQRADEYLERIKTDGTFLYKKDTAKGKKGELNTTQFNKELDKMNRLKAAAATFDTYITKLKANSRYDFDDMINWVLQAFQQNESMLLTYQERYLYFLVDEFQDTSGTQNMLLTLLTAYWQNNPNIFCVGDDDQSIFRFQGANVENIHSFIKQYSPHVITLEDNYRSSPPILNAARILIAQNKSRINPDKILYARSSVYAELDVKPILCEYHNSVHEAADIGMQIEELKRQGVALNQIAVIYPKHKVAEPVLRYLEACDIPYHIKRSANALDEITVRQLLHILRYIVCEIQKPHSGEYLLYEMLHFDCFQINSVLLARLSREVEQQYKADRMYSWRQAMSERAKGRKEDLFTGLSDENKLAHASRVIEGWIKEASNLTTAGLIEKVINESGILVKALTHEDKIGHMQVLHTFFDYVKTESARNPRLTLSQFMETLQLMQDEKIVLPLQKIAYADDGVQFLTVHSSKGLEFEYVFMISCDKDSWDKGIRKGFSFPDNLVEISTHNEEEERRRLFYVGMTRAKKHLAISWPAASNSGKETEPSRFAAELMLNADIEKRRVHVNNDQLTQFKLHEFTYQQPTASADLFDNEWVDELLKNYALSVTHLNNYLKCPTAFYFNNLLRIPAPLSPAMTFGSAIHHALEKVFKKLQETQILPSAADLLSYYRYFMFNHQEAFTSEDFKRRMEYGELILEKYYARYSSGWTNHVLLERKYSDVLYNGMRLTGMLDKLELDGKKVTVVDYKTGKPENAQKKLNAPTADEIQLAQQTDDFDTVKHVGGDYWRQAAFYKLLIEHSPGNTWEVEKIEFDFVEPDKKSGEFIKATVPLSESGMHVLATQIKGAYERITNQIFEPGCHDPDCAWCTFVSTYYKGSTSLKTGAVADETE
ncbi:MAG: ATP-dependent helicase [Bacteroidota bacterium]